jgi:hypothetical protein
MKKTFIILVSFLAPHIFAQTDSLTGIEILDLSIEHCGGMEAISKIETTELNYVFTTADKIRISIIDKRVAGAKFSQSIFADSHVPQATFFNGSEYAVVNGTEVFKTDSIQKFEEIKLRTYNQLQFGYKTLGYEITRIADEKFNHFDCFVLSAVSPNGYATLNYIDKTDYRLLMVIYPEGNKSVMTKFKFIDGILFNSVILNTNREKEITKLELLKVKNNIHIAESWFTCPYTDEVSIPDYIKIGKFNPYGKKSILERTKKKQLEYSEDESNVTELDLTWNSDDTFTLKQKKTSKTGKKLEHDLKVRIVSWDEKGYVCHYLYGTSFGTQEYLIMN